MLYIMCVIDYVVNLKWNVDGLVTAEIYIKLSGNLRPAHQQNYVCITSTLP